MSGMQVLRALVTERLAVAAEEILVAVGRILAEKRTLGAPEMSPEEQRAVVHERLSVAADEIYRILEIMTGERDADVCGSREGIKPHRQLLDITWRTETKLHRTDGLPGSYCEKDVTSKLLRCEWSRISSQCQETSNPLQINDASAELTNKACARAEKCSLSMVETQTRGERCVVPERDQNDLSPDSSEARTDHSDAELNEKSLTSNERKGFQRRGRGADCCKMCGASFQKGTKIKQHSRTITPTNNIPTTRQSCCRVCGKAFRYKRSFLKHVLQHEQTSDRCGACGKHLGSDESLRVHLQSHKEENICGHDRPSEAERSDAESEGSDDWKDGNGDSPEGERDVAGLRKSEKRRSNKANGSKRKDASQLKYRCKVCCRAFCYRASFLKHVQEDERDAEICGVCGERFHSEDSLRLHLRTYIRTNDCEVCGKHFDGHKQLEMHTRTHTGEKPYICAVCGKAFAQNGNLTGHMRVHTGERPYVCSVCGQSFGFKEYMTAHLRIHTGEKPFLCSVCGKGFRQRGTLKTHAMIHTGESTHQCSVCGKKFYKSGALKIHMRAHTGEKPYVCNVCGKSFAAGGSLTKHMGVHEGAPTHRCDICRKGFLRSADLKRHVEAHGDESTQLTSRQ